MVEELNRSDVAAPAYTESQSKSKIRAGFHWLHGCSGEPSSALRRVSIPLIDWPLQKVSAEPIFGFLNCVIEEPLARPIESKPKGEATDKQVIETSSNLRPKANGECQ
jgi:hypothetical protein